MSAPMQRSCWATANDCWLPPAPPGRAFEGAQISGGQRAAPGAIERVRVDPNTLEPRFRVIGLATSGPMIRVSTSRSGEQGVTGICGSGIIEAVAGLYLAGVIQPDGTIDGAAADKNPRICADGRTFSYLLHEGEPQLVIQQGDVRAIQLAKAALYAGARLLMDHMGVEQVDRIRLAGAFGSHIDVKYAMVLGMLPDCDLAKVSSAKNAAGTGRTDCTIEPCFPGRDRGAGPHHRENRNSGGSGIPGSFRAGHGHSSHTLTSTRASPGWCTCPGLIRRKPGAPRRAVAADADERPESTWISGSGSTPGAPIPTRYSSMARIPLSLPPNASPRGTIFPWASERPCPQLPLGEIAASGPGFPVHHALHQLGGRGAGRTGCGFAGRIR